MPEIRLFSLCEGMKWAHLPVAGGLYDQDPILLERWRIIFAKRAEYQERERQKQERQSGSSSGRRVAGRR